MSRLLREKGQSLIEFTLVTPLLLVLAFGVIEFGWVLLDEHVVTKLSREGSNLISRNTPITQARAALESMSARPVDFASGSRLIFSVIRMATTGANQGFHIIYQRYDYGDSTLPGSVLQMQGSGSFVPPDYVAVAHNTNTGLRAVPSTLPQGLNLPPGGMLYVTEIYSRHQLLTPLDRLGITVPQTLYSIAYF